MTRFTGRAALVAAVAAFSAINGCGSCGHKQQQEPEVAAEGGDDKPGISVASEGPGLKFRLSEGAPPMDHPPLAPATPLAPADVKAILARMPTLTPSPDDEKDFALREESKPPPKTGTTIKEAFPPPPTDLAPTGGPPTPNGSPKELSVLRHQPDGEVPIAPNVSVTFSQPMIAVTSHDDLSKQVLPVKLTPQPKGKWRWVGTRTLLFEPDPRFPMATEYTIEIPAGTKSAVGGTLAKAETYRFATPPLNVVQAWPQGGEPQSHDPLMMMVFDQRVDQTAVLASITLDAKGKRKLRLATEAEIQADDTILAMRKSVSADLAPTDQRWVIFKSVDALPASADVTMTLAKGAPSEEGPRKTKDERSFQFKTYGPLVVESHECYGDCPPGQAWYIQLSNPLDPKVKPNLLREQIHVKPEVPGLRVQASGRQLYLWGHPQGRRDYTVTLTTAVSDRFGQHLAKNEDIVFHVGPAEKQLSGPDKMFSVADPMSKPHFSVYSTNFKTLRVKIWRVQPADWYKYLTYLDEYYRHDRAPVMPGELVVDESVKVAGEDDQLTETRIDLAKALGGKEFGQLIVHVEEPSPKDRWEMQRVESWVQVTAMSVDALSDQTELHGWTTALADGKPLDGVTVSIYPTPDGEAKATGTTGADGLTTLALSTTEPNERGSLLIAQKGDDLAILPESASYYGGRGMWTRRQGYDQLVYHIFDDRSMYRPGETVHVKGWMRKLGAARDAELSATGATHVAWHVYDSQSNDIGNGTSPVTPLGGFDLTYTLPKTVNLGYTRIEFTADGPGLPTEMQHAFQVQEFRRPEYAVSAAVADGPFVIGDHADVTLSASYYAGGGLANAPASWSVSASPAYFTPPNRPDWSFGGVAVDEYSYGRRGYGNGRNRYGRRRYDDEAYGPGSHPPAGPTTLAGRTNASGEHHLRIDFDGVDPARPMTVTASAGVADVNRQTWYASATMLVHPANLYVGLKPTRPFVEKGKAIEVDGIVVDLDGKAAPGRPIAMHAVRLEGQWTQDGYEIEEKEPQDCTVVSKADAANGDADGARCRFLPKEGGEFRVVASITDAKGRKNETVITIWVAGEKVQPSREVGQEEVKLVADKTEYQPGDTAEILVRAPFTPATGLVTLRRNGIVSVEEFTMNEPTKTLKVPITETQMPSITVQVSLVGAAVRTNDDGEPDPTLAKRPAYASGQTTLAIPPRVRKLDVKVAPLEAELEPGGETDVDVMVKDARGKPVQGAEMAVIVVDEAVLALTNYQLRDPLNTFYVGRGAGGYDLAMRAFLLLASAQDLNADKNGDGGVLVPTDKGTGGGPPGGGHAIQEEEGQMGRPMKRALEPAPVAAPMAKAEPDKAAATKMDEKPKAASHTGYRSGGGGGNGQPVPEPPIAVRTNFDPLAVFSPAVPSDVEGHARVHVKLPDNLTKYRVMVVAVSGDKFFGAGESAITARMPLMVRPSPPRFLNFGDTFELPVVVQNQTKLPMTVDVALRVSNARLADGEEGATGRRVTVPANDRVEVRFPAAAKRAGTARFQVGVVSGKWADAAEMSLPVWTPATTEAFATYGTIDQPGAMIQPVAMPTGVVKEFGGLEITTSSTALASLTDAVLYLESYRFECAEQVSSRLLAVASLKDVLGAFHAEGLPPVGEMIAAVDRDVDRLHGLQNYDGGFSFWERDRESWPFVSTHVAHALIRAQKKGFHVPVDMISGSQRYLASIDEHIPSYYSMEERRAIQAYALYVRKLMGDQDGARAAYIMNEAKLDELSLETAGWLVYALVGVPGAAAKDAQAKLLRLLGNRATEEAGTANFVDRYGDGAYLILASDRRADGVVLDALIAADPKNDLIPKVVRGLLAHRTAGHWGNTQENSFVLLALDAYFHAFENVTPDFVASVWLGDTYAGKHAFQGRTTEESEIDIPMKYLDTAALENLAIDKQGAGRMYYRIGMRYAPADLELPPAEHGFTVERRYEPVDDKGDVTYAADGTWHVKAGTRVRVRLTMANESRRYHVALVDPLPAGLEALNPEIRGTGDVPHDPSVRADSWNWNASWFEHENMRDERIEAFTSLLWEGVWTYTYVARATTPGSFVVPPAKAEEMYAPETFGRSAGDKLVVE